MRIRPFTTAALVALLGAACGGAADEAPAREAREAGQASRTAAATPATHARDTAAAPARAWEIAITGVDLPDVGGASVMAMNMPGNVATYRFVNPRFMGSIEMAATEVGAPISATPYNMQLNYLDEQWTCGMSALNGEQELELRIERTATGYRGTYAGAVVCTRATGGARTTARVEGWFEK